MNPNTLEHAFFHHPVFRYHDFHLETHAMREIRMRIQQWVWFGHPGGLVLGSPRIGKTHAMRCVMREICQRNGQAVPGYYISIPRRDTQNIKSIWRLLCLESGLHIGRDNTDVLSDRFTQYLFELCHSQQSEQLLFIVDEMQRLAARQFEAFAELFDKLNVLGVRASIIFVGNARETNTILQHLSADHFDHIQGRFLKQRSMYYGLRSEKEVRYCLEQYDTLHYPEDGPSYTRYFLPPETPDTWRLASLSRSIWRGFRRVQTKYGVNSWGMQYFVCAVNALLTDFLSQPGAVECYEDAMFDACIDVSGLITSSVEFGSHEAY